MDKVVLDDALRSKLNGFRTSVEVCDETGHTVGQFVPQELFLKLVYAWANAQVTDEELDRISQEPGGRSLAEIWKSLGRT
jgi:hypothetical protein